MKTKHVAGLFVLLLLQTATSWGQLEVRYPATNYSLTILNQNKINLFFPGGWQDNWKDNEDLGSGKLVLVHTATLSGDDVLQIKALMDVYIYHYYGGIASPIGGYHITVFGTSPWNASTNNILASDMSQIIWDPYRVGSRTDPDKFSRTITTGSSIVMNGENLSGSPKVLWFPCATDTGKTFGYPFRFRAVEKKNIVMSLKYGNLEAPKAIRGFSYFWFNPDLSSGGSPWIQDTL